MPASSQSLFAPRKAPVQTRSAASVEAILDATVQVLTAVGRERLTTTRVAHRAGVSVGTLYQYFPNKSALLQAVLERHLDAVALMVERVCREQAGCPVPAMVSALIEAFFAAKLKDPRVSVALYAVSADLDGARISRSKSGRIQTAIAGMLASAQPAVAADVELAAAVLQGALAGISRTLLDGESPERHMPPLRDELIAFACGYLSAPRPGQADA